MDLFVFFVAFESILIPMILLILFGSFNLRKIRAILYFVLYTVFGSLFLFYAVFVVYLYVGTGSYIDLQFAAMPASIQRLL